MVRERRKSDFFNLCTGGKRGIKYIFSQNVFLVNMTRVQNSGKISGRALLV